METQEVPTSSTESQMTIPTPSQEAPIMTLTPEEAHKKLDKASPQERTEHFLGSAQRLIREGKDKGIFDTDEKIATSEQALSYKGGKVDEGASQGIKAILDSLSQTQNNVAQETRAELSKYVRIKARETGAEKFYTQEEWQQKLNQATPEEKAQLEKEGLYGFVFPEQKPPEDEIIATHISALELQIKTAKEKGEDTKQQEQLLKTLRLTQKANGEIGFLFKMKALQELKESGVQNLDAPLKNLQERIPEAQKKLDEHLKGQGLSEDETKTLKATVEKGLDTLLASGLLSKIEGLDQLVFGKTLDDTAIKELLQTKLGEDEAKNYLLTHGENAGKALLLIMLLALVGSAVVVTQGMQNMGRN